MNPQHQCMHPGCPMKVFENQFLCFLHSSPHKPRQVVEDDDE